MPEAERAVRAIGHDPFAGPAIERVFASGAAQREVWLSATQGDDASCAFNECTELVFASAIDIDALKGSLERLAATHDGLRAVFSRSGERLLVLARATLDWRVTPLADGDARARQLESARRDEVTNAFDLEAGPLWRVRVLSAADRCNVLITFHHIVADGWSIAVALDDLARFYRDAVARRVPGDAGVGPEPKTPSLGDYLRQEREAQASGETEATLAWWLERFASPPAPLELPRDRPRPPLRSFAGARIDVEIDPEVAAATRRAATANGATPFTWMLAAWFAMLQHLAGDTDLVVGVPSAGQASSGLPRLVGHCVNMLPLRQRVDPAIGFADFMKRCRSTLLDAQEHAGLTFGDLVTPLGMPRDRSRVPLVATTFNIDQEARRLDFGDDPSTDGGLETRYASVPRRFETFEWCINVGLTAERATIECTFNTDLFEASNMRHRMEAFVALLRQVALAPDTRIDELSPWTDGDQGVLDALNDTARPLPEDEDLALLLERSAARHPTRLAVVAGAERYDYARLEGESLQLARALHAAGVSEGDPVAICIERGAALVPVLYAVRKLGATCVPLDPAAPPERRRHLLEDSGARYLVQDDGAPAEALPAGVTTLPLARLRDAAAAQDPPSRRMDPDACAYVLYTSGSTGRPKGVRVSRANETNLLRAMLTRPGIGAGDRLLAVTTVAFDIALPELFLPLLAGACTVVATREVATDPAALAAALEAEAITVMQATPSTWRALLDDGWHGRPGLVALVGGEPLPQDLLERLLPRTRAVWNLYGPTETTVWSTAARLRDAAQPVTIGRPLDNTRVHLLDDRGRPVPLGSVGELWIGGAGVALGYHDRPELTERSFVPDRFDRERDGARLYRTGDLCRLHADGRLEHLGRADDQVKLRGHRVELGEIETVLASHPDVSACVARVDVHPGTGLARLHAWCRGDVEALDVAELRRFARRTLPDYMVPEAIVGVRELPLTANGKIDRKRLPAIEVRAAPPVDVHRASETERWIADRWAAIGVDAPASATSNFFDIGGHSLLAMRFIRDVQERFDVRLSLRSLLADSLEELAGNIDRHGAGDVPRRDVAPDASGADATEPDAMDLDAADPGVTDRAPRSSLKSFFLDIGDGPGRGRILCHHHRPARADANANGVLIAAPIGHEYMRSHRVLQQLAVRLAAAGRHVLRFDHRGTGDSSGDDHDVSLEDLQADLAIACEHSSGLAGGRAPDIVGLRLGATLAARHASLRCGALVLVDPLPSGRDWIVGLEGMQRRMRGDLDRFRWRRKDPGIPDELLGFRYPAGLRTGLERLELAAGPSAAHSALHVLQSRDEPRFPAAGKPAAGWPLAFHSRLAVRFDWGDAARIEDALLPRGLIDTVCHHLGVERDA